MDTKIEKLPKSKLKIQIGLSSEEFSPYLVMAEKEISKTLNVSGFRPGKIPAEMVEKHAGTERILEQASEIAINKVFAKVVEEKKLNILGKPKAKIEKISKEILETSIEVEVFPQIRLADWKKITETEPQKKVKIEEKEIAKLLENLQKSRAKYIKSLEPVKLGNQIEIDYEIRNGAVKVENGDIKNQKFILGEGKLIPKFEENLIGMKEGEEKKFSLAAPSNFWKKELQGKLLNFKVKMKEVFRVELPEVNDKWACSLEGIKNLEDLKRNLQKGIRIEKETAEKKRWQGIIFEKISQKSEIELPDILVIKERDQMIEVLKKKTEEMGLSFEAYLSQLKKSLEELKKDFLIEAEKRVRIFLCMYEVAKMEKINVNDEEVEKEIDIIVKKYPNLDSRFGDQEKENLKNYVRENILQRKVMERVENVSSKPNVE